MIAVAAHRTVTSAAQLREIIEAPAADGLVRRKELAVLDAHCRLFIEKSPFLLLGTASAAGRCDVTPRGDGPGFVGILDERTLLVPDRPGNRRLDSMLNIIANPHAGLLFMIPGVDETLRVNGSASVTEDPALLAPMAVKGKTPPLGIVVEVEEVFFHCARAFKRSRLWVAESWPDRAELPSLGRILADQTKLANTTSADLDSMLDESNKHLY